MNPPIRLHNTLSRTEELLRTERPDRVTMYVCGPTVYNYAHIGNAWPANLLVLLVRGYQLCISPMFGPRCRFHPTCSQYAIDALRTHGSHRPGGHHCAMA